MEEILSNGNLATYSPKLRKQYTSFNQYIPDSIIRTLSDKTVTRVMPQTPKPRGNVAAQVPDVVSCFWCLLGIANYLGSWKSATTKQFANV